MIIRTRQVAHVSVDKGAGDDAPAVERLPVRAVRPPQARVRVRIEVPAVVELPLRRLLQLVRVDGERRHCERARSVQRPSHGIDRQHTLTGLPAMLEDLALVEGVVGRGTLGLVLGVHCILRAVSSRSGLYASVASGRESILGTKEGSSQLFIPPLVPHTRQATLEFILSTTAQRIDRGTETWAMQTTMLTGPLGQNTDDGVRKASRRIAGGSPRIATRAAETTPAEHRSEAAPVGLPPMSAHFALCGYA